MTAPTPQLRIRRALRRATAGAALATASATVLALLPTTLATGSVRTSSSRFRRRTDPRAEATTREAARADARLASERLTAIVDATPDVVGTAGPDGRLHYLNEAGRRLLGLASDAQVAAARALDLYPPWARQVLVDTAIPTAAREGSWSGELALLDPAGLQIPVSQVVLAHQGPDGSVEYFSTIIRDIRERKALEGRLRHQALHDPLTGLPNRELFRSQLERSLAAATRSDSVAVLLVDIDHFKVVNDSIGHAVGDELLRALTERLTAALPPNALAGRFGGDEFTVLYTGIAGRHEATWCAQRLATVLAEPLVVSDREVVLTSSIGIALASPGDDAGAVVRGADTALHRAKARGRARAEVFDDDMRAWAQRRLDTETALRRAVPDGELALVYQPVVSLADGRVQGYEALVRWQHPTEGLLGPERFIHIAEETGLIVPIGTWVLREACSRAAEWSRPGGAAPGATVAVNLSARQLVDRDLPDVVAAILADTGVQPSQVCLEITESVLVADEIASEAALRALKRLGVRIAIDDFGTGHSSLTRLQRFPVDVLKLDRSFVAGVGRDRGDTAIVAAVVRLARALGLGTVAEGAETAEQLRWLAGLGWEAAQGFYFSPPQPPAVAETLLCRRWAWDVDPLTRATTLAAGGGAALDRLDRATAR